MVPARGSRMWCTHPGGLQTLRICEYRLCEGVPTFSEFNLGALNGGHRGDDGIDDRDLEPNAEVMEELVDITHLPLMDVSHIRTLLSEVGSPSGPPSLPLSTSSSGLPIRVDALHEHFFDFED